MSTDDGSWQKPKHPAPKSAQAAPGLDKQVALKDPAEPSRLSIGTDSNRFASLRSTTESDPDAGFLDSDSDGEASLDKLKLTEGVTSQTGSPLPATHGRRWGSVTPDPEPEAMETDEPRSEPATADADATVTASQTTQTDATADSAAYTMWKAAGKPLCPTCDRPHPPPCDPEKAKKAIFEKQLAEYRPEEYQRLQKEKKVKSRRATKERKRLADKQQAEQEQSQTTSQEPAAQPEQPATKDAQTAPTGEKRSAKARNVAFCRRCNCSHSWGKHVQAQRPPRLTGAQFPSLPGQTAAQSAKVPLVPPPQGRGRTFRPIEVMSHVMNGINTQEGLTFFREMVNMGGRDVTRPQPQSFARAAASATTNAGRGGANAPDRQQNQRQTPRAGGNAPNNPGGANRPPQGREIEMADAPPTDLTVRQGNGANAATPAAAGEVSSDANPAASSSDGTKVSKKKAGKQPVTK